MKKITTLLASFFLLFSVAKAQYVNIPDTNFAKYLTKELQTSWWYKDNNNLYWIDTTSSGVLNMLSLTPEVDSIKDLTGIEYFKNLQSLLCDYNQLTSLSKLPKTLTYLSCSNNLLTSLPKLSDSLTILNCSKNLISSLPTLPNSLTQLYCNTNSLTSLPTLPSSLNYIDCSNNLITSLPALSNSLTKIVCSNNLLSSLPALPSSLTYLDCSYNLLTGLPSLPSLLNDIEIYNNQLTSLPSVLPKSLLWLNCYNNQLSSLPSILPDSLQLLQCTKNKLTNLTLILPNSLQWLECYNNQLVSLPTLPNSLNYLYCYKNPNLHCLPLIPDSLKGITLDSSTINCIPNTNSVLTVYDTLNNVLKLPICNATNNPNSCKVYGSNYVNIPDTNFAKYLITQIPGCLYKDSSNKYWMDTTCSGVLNLKNIYCFKLQIKTIEGIEYFKNLDSLTCSFDSLTNLPLLPGTLKVFDCEYNNIKNIPILPDSLIYFSCNKNKLTSLPVLPLNLQNLLCDFNQLTNLPALPNSLQTLSCWANGINILPALPDSLTSLICGGNGINNLPTLPNSLQYLFCNDNNLKNLPSLPNSLLFLNADLNQITSIDSLPVNLTSLICSNNKLTTLPALPNALTGLNCSLNQLTSLPALPNALTGLSCYSNQLSSLPNLPDSITSIACYSNPNLSCLPKLPGGFLQLNLDTSKIHCIPNNSGMVYVYNNYSTTILTLPVCNTIYNPNSCTIYSNPYINIPDSNFAKYLISQIPSCLYKDSSNLYWMDTTCSGVLNTQSLYPNGDSIRDLTGIVYFKNLTYLDCSNNLLSSLPTLPNTLFELFCKNNLLTNIQSLPGSLSYLSITNNQLSSLPTLPNYLGVLWCDTNKLSILPNLPSTLYELNVMGNPNLNCLPIIPVTLQRLFIDSSNIHCLPNIILGFVWCGSTDTFQNHPPLQITVCNPTSNANQCQVFPIVYGKVFTDNNSNGIKDSNEYYRPYVQLTLNTGESVLTNTNGEYKLNLSDTGTYTLTTRLPNGFKASPASNTFTFNNNYPSLILQDIALQPLGVYDSLTVFITPWTGLNTKPASQLQYFVSYENVGYYYNIQDSIKITYDTSKLQLDSSSIPVVSQSGNTILASIDSLFPGIFNYFFLYFSVKSTAVSGDSILANASINSQYSSDTSFSQVNVLASYDPNSKDATPVLSPAQVANGSYIDYTIHFQNTGTDTAFNVVLADTLSPFLQSNILQMVATSHPCNITLKDSIIYFEFLKVNLPDSGHNQSKSNGFVHFKLLPVSTVTLGNTIDNKASIYFDYNKPVVTNTASTIIQNPILPVIIKSYNVSLITTNMQTVLNSWSTSNEVNLCCYNVQKSIDGSNFSTIGKVTADGSGVYSFTDSLTIQNSRLTILYYRLQIVDKNGKTSYSDTKQITIQPFVQSIGIYPNPAKNFIVIRGNNVSAINIIDNTGRLVMSKNGLDINAVENKLNISLSSGIYLARIIQTDGKIVNEKFIIKN